jgi:hypothetical protein
MLVVQTKLVAELPVALDGNPIGSSKLGGDGG